MIRIWSDLVLPPGKQPIRPEATDPTKLILILCAAALVAAAAVVLTVVLVRRKKRK
ncbi:MAG: hypothetical protein IJK88_00960 [Clostridia bacterium]|nr:hypothetical protein [Clostridia bacterium]MBR3130656.1 hypothetical protein [Clostridia bacterium]